MHMVSRVTLFFISLAGFLCVVNGAPVSAYILLLAIWGMAHAVSTTAYEDRQQTLILLREIAKPKESTEQQTAKAHTNLQESRKFSKPKAVETEKTAKEETNLCDLPFFPDSNESKRA